MTSVIITGIIAIIMSLSMVLDMVSEQKPSRKSCIVFYISGICFALSSILFVIAVIRPTLFFGDVIVKEQYSYNISAVEDNRDIEGRLRGSRYYTRGYINQTLYYYVVQENNGYKSIQKIPANKTRIIESDNEQPKIVYYGEYFERTEKPVGEHFRFNKDYYELYVPSDTVTDSWLIDLE